MEFIKKETGAKFIVESQMLIEMYEADERFEKAEAKKVEDKPVKAKK